MRNASVLFVLLVIISSSFVVKAEVPPSPEVRPKIVPIEEPQENDSALYLDLGDNSIERGDGVNITFGMQNQSNTKQFVGGYLYSLSIDGAVHETLIDNKRTIPLLMYFFMETYESENLTRFPGGNYTITFLVNSTNRGIMKLQKYLFIETNPNASVKFIIAQVNHIGFTVNRSENIILVMENVGAANAFDINIDIQTLEEPLGLVQSSLPFHLPILQPNHAKSLKFVLNPGRLGIGLIELRTEFRNSEGVASNGILRLDVPVLPRVITQVQISPDIQVDNISTVKIDIINLENQPILIRNKLESDKIFFNPSIFTEFELEKSISVEFTGRVFEKGWAYVSYTLTFLDSDGEGEAVLVKDSLNIKIGDTIGVLGDKNQDFTTILLLILLILTLIALGVVILLLLRPMLKNRILQKLLPTKINRRVDYPTDKILIDGSNVAWDEPSPDGKADIANLVLAVRELENAGFREIKVIVDAALRYQVKDTKKFDELAKKGVFKVLPAKVSGDLFILRLSQQTGAVILTNDLFKEFRERFKWIDSRRVPFSIIGGQFFLHPLASTYS